MVQSIPECQRPWVKYAGAAVVVLLLILAAFYVVLFIRVVPPLRATLVDAVSGQPVAGMNVCLQVSYHPWEMQAVLRREEINTAGSARFFFWPSIHHMSLLQTWEGYAIRVTDAQTDFKSPCGGELGLDEMTEAHKWPIYLGPNEGGRSKYFPLVLISRGASRREPSGWSAMRREIGSVPDSRIALIPILQDPNECKRIADAVLAEDCRQLNTFAAALSLRENQDAASRARALALCSEVDQIHWSTVCQGRLNGFAMLQRAQQFRGDYALTAGVPGRQPASLFPLSIAGVPRLDGDMADDGSLGTGRRMYIGSYVEPNSGLITVQIEEFPNAERARLRFQELPGGFADRPAATESEEETGPGGKIERHRGPQESGAFWVSNNIVVLIKSNPPFPKADDLIYEYLRQFPSSW